MGRRPKGTAELMNELVVAGAQRDEIGWIVRSPSADTLNVMNMQPSLVRAAIAASVDEGAAPPVASIDGVEFARREGLALARRQIPGTRARFCVHGL